MAGFCLHHLFGPKGEGLHPNAWVLLGFLIHYRRSVTPSRWLLTRQAPIGVCPLPYRTRIVLPRSPEWSVRGGRADLMLERRDISGG